MQLGKKKLWVRDELSAMSFSWLASQNSVFRNAITKSAITFCKFSFVFCCEQKYLSAKVTFVWEQISSTCCWQLGGNI